MTNSAEKYFDCLAEVYDQATAPEGAWTPPQMIERMLRPALAEHKSVLDIGVGTGQALALIYKSGQFDTLDAIDISADFLKQCTDKFPNIKTFHGTFSSFCKQDHRRFDIIICCGVLEFIQDPEELIALVGSRLTDDGSFVFTFEPIVAEHKLQSNRQSLTVPDPTSSLYFDDFFTYRWTPQEIDGFLKKANMHAINQEAFVAYRKQGVDIIYHILDTRLITA
ncbi:class I SAM-dependent methyltransferase [Oligoflexia bacterium]|nr:class I SAM-dependent methyltransferase [Oligoflexia bacterium]